MPRQALPCIVCGRELLNVFADMVENQPDSGIACTSGGNYGSTVFDPMNGEYLELNICDPCLTRAGEQGRVLTGRSRRPVAVEGLLVGWERIERPLVPWTAGLPGYGADTLNLEVEDLEGGLPPTVELRWTAEEAGRMLEGGG
jgi:hypothetical protein